MAASAPWKVSVRVFAALLGLILLAGIVEAPFLTFYRISGNSMLPAFNDGDRVLVFTCPSLAGGIEPGDAVIAQHDGEVLIKRVLAGPGDRIEMLDGIVHRNGAVADELLPAEHRDHGFLPPRELGDDEYFVLGDNRRVSVDSRSFGPVPLGAIIGKVVYRIESGEGTPVTAAEKR